MNGSRLLSATPFLTAVLLLCSASLAHAGPEEDYAEGAKLFDEGKVVESLAPLKRSADQGYVKAQALLADILDSSEFDEEAVNYYRKAADQGNADAQFNLGAMYARGEGVTQDLAEARKWILKAAGQGNQNAIRRVAHGHIRGDLGFDETARNGPEALEWIKRAANLDDTIALTALAAAYRNGAYGLAADPKQAEGLEARLAALRSAKPKPAAAQDKPAAAQK